MGDFSVGQNYLNYEVLINSQRQYGNSAVPSGNIKMPDKNVVKEVTSGFEVKEEYETTIDGVKVSVKVFLNGMADYKSHKRTDRTSKRGI